MKALKWIPPCGCILYLTYENDQKDVWRNDRTKSWVAKEFKLSSNTENRVVRSQLCKDHLSIPLQEARDVCWNECKKVSSCLRYLNSIVATVEKDGEQERYLGGIIPIEVVEWKGTGANRNPVIRINKKFRKGIITQSKLAELRVLVSKDFPDVEILNELP